MGNPIRESLLAHQWGAYSTVHRAPANLLIHIVAVPAFLVSNVVFVAAAMWGLWLLSGLALAVMAASMMAQGRGHRLEPDRPEPFTDPLNAVTRILAEQWITVPRFVLSGKWWGAWRQRQRAS